MAKKRAPATTGPAEASFVRCAGYTLKVINNYSNGTDFEIAVEGEDGEHYNLQVTSLSDRTALVQALFQRIGMLWPAFDFEFRADAANRIVDVR